MMRLEEISVVVLASGLSRRFRGGNKLLALYQGKPVAAHIAELLGAMPFKSCVAVTPTSNNRLSDMFENNRFRIVENPHPEYGKGASLALGAKAVSIQNPKAILVCLADMPCITEGVITKLCASLNGADAAICWDGKVQSPPAIFSNNSFDKLTILQGDVGARNVLRKLKDVVQVKMHDAAMVDVDTDEDLKSLSRNI